MTKVDMLGLCLFYLRTSDIMQTICPCFGLTQSFLSTWLNYAMDVLLRMITKRGSNDFAVRWPCIEEIRYNAALLKAKRRYGIVLDRIFAVTDGARMSCVSFEEPQLQNAYYQGYNQKVEVTNLLVWAFTGEIIHAAVNYPGSWHDNRIAALLGLYWPLLSDQKTPSGYAILGDSAFVNNMTATNGKVVRARKLNELSRMPMSAACQAIDQLLHHLYPKERQSAEWGVRGLSGPFRRFHSILPSNDYKQYRIISSCVHLVNYRTKRIGRNQIRSVYHESSIPMP